MKYMCSAYAPLCNNNIMHISVSPYSVIKLIMPETVDSLQARGFCISRRRYLVNIMNEKCNRRQSNRPSVMVVILIIIRLSSTSLKITDRSFRYASPCLWNQLSLSLRQPHSGTSSSISYSSILLAPLLPLLIQHSAHSLLPLSFTSGLKPTCVTNPTPRSFTSSSQTAFRDYYSDRYF